MVVTKLQKGILQENAELEIKKGKTSFPKEALKTYSAFSNTSGGILLLGYEEIDDNGFKLYEACGVDNPEKVIKEMFDLLNDSTRVSKNIITDKNIQIDIADNGKQIIIIEIPQAKYSDKPVYLNSNPYKNTYKRSSSGDYRCTKEEIDAMIRDSVPEPQDRTIIDYIEYRTALDSVTISKYRNIFIQRSGDHPFVLMDDEEFLKKIGAIAYKNGEYYPTIAGLIVFGKTEFITQVLPNFLLEYVNYGDSNIDRWTDRVIYDGTWGEGNIFNFYYLVINKLKNTLLNKFALDKDNITRIDTSQLEIAFREALANCLIHADYRADKRIKISYKNKQYTFFNPGSLRVTKSEFFEGKYSNPRNPTIATILRFIGVAEEAGSGVPKILHALRANKLAEPELLTIDDNVEFIISISPEIEYLAAKFNLNEEEVSVLSAINDHYSLSRSEIEKVTNFSRKRSLNIINSLKERKIIEQVGRSSSTKYRISRNHMTNNQALINMLQHTINLLQRNR